MRRADPSRDAAPCAALYAPYVEGSVISFEARAPTAREMAERMRAHEGTHPWLVVEEGEEVVGFAYATPHRAREAYRHSVEVSVYVAESSRRRGHGRALYAALLDDLRQRGYHVACAGITLPNEGSVALHEDFGFEPVGVYREIGWKQGAWRDVGWWQLRLGPAVPPTTMEGHV